MNVAIQDGGQRMRKEPVPGPLLRGSRSDPDWAWDRGYVMHMHIP